MAGEPQLVEVDELHRLIEQLCKDLNGAQDEITRLQGVPDSDLHKYDWPEWTPQANSIRWAERVLECKLAKTKVVVHFEWLLLLFLCFTVLVGVVVGGENIKSLRVSREAPVIFQKEWLRLAVHSVVNSYAPVKIFLPQSEGIVRDSQLFIKRIGLPKINVSLNDNHDENGKTEGRLSKYLATLAEWHPNSNSPTNQTNPNNADPKSDSRTSDRAYFLFVCTFTIGLVMAIFGLLMFFHSLDRLARGNTKTCVLICLAILVGLFSMILPKVVKGSAKGEHVTHPSLQGKAKARLSLDVEEVLVLNNTNHEYSGVIPRPIIRIESNHRSLKLVLGTMGFFFQRVLHSDPCKPRGSQTI